MSAKEFNTKYLNSSYKNDFLYELFMKKTIFHRDRENGILIKVN